ncbi:MAG: MBL fold metallo-hydrolase [bacterium]|nr:MBL fold metallo-hydrolase [bacterium]
MFEVVFFGTSASAPSIHRGLPALAVLAGEHRFLVDCGEGTQRQILRSGIGFKKLNKVLLTHGHLDHILGLGGLISTFVRWEENIDQIEIWGGRTVLDRVQALLYEVVFRNEKLPIPLHLIDVKPGRLFHTKDFTVSAFPVQHRGPDNFGYVFQEKTHRPFLVEKAEALGVPAGPERSLLVRGESVTLNDGRTITPDMVLGEEIAGSKLVCVGDIVRLEPIKEYVREAHALVIEATFLDVEADTARAFGHITAKQAAELALECGVKTLLLTHISRRYRERDVIAEARAIFPETYVARDLDHFIIRRDKPVEKKVAEAEEEE